MLHRSNFLEKVELIQLHTFRKHRETKVLFCDGNVFYFRDGYAKCPVGNRPLV